MNLGRSEASLQLVVAGKAGASHRIRAVGEGIPGVRGAAQQADEADEAREWRGVGWRSVRSAVGCAS